MSFANNACYFVRSHCLLQYLTNRCVTCQVQVPSTKLAQNCRIYLSCQIVINLFIYFMCWSISNRINSTVATIYRLCIPSERSAYINISQYCHTNNKEKCQPMVRKIIFVHRLRSCSWIVHYSYNLHLLFTTVPCISKASRQRGLK